MGAFAVGVVATAGVFGRRHGNAIFAVIIVVIVVIIVAAVLMGAGRGSDSARRQRRPGLETLFHFADASFETSEFLGIPVYSVFPGEKASTLVCTVDSAPCRSLPLSPFPRTRAVSPSFYKQLLGKKVVTRMMATLKVLVTEL